MSNKMTAVMLIRYLKICAALLFSLVFFACGGIALNGGAPVEMTLSPVDSNYDVARSAGDFAFESYVTVTLDLRITIIDEQGEYLPGEDRAVLITVAAPDGGELFRGMADADGRLEGFFGISAAVSSVILTVEGQDLDSRSLIIENPSTLSVIRRKIQVAAPLLRTRALSSPLPDTDGDGVPDIYDAYPDDPEIAFEVSFPADGSRFFTVAYEDNFPALGDGDYNDFVVNYSITARVVLGKLFAVTGTATALAKVAGYDHEFGLMLRIPGASGTLSTTLNGAAQIQNLPMTEEFRIPLFTSTAEVLANGGGQASFTILLNTTPGTLLTDMPPAPFDPYLYIKNTDYDVHLIGQEPLPGSRLTSDEDYRDGDGFPRALLVPGNFSPPGEVTSILDAYPLFQSWVDTEGTEAVDWYFYPESDYVMDLSGSL